LRQMMSILPIMIPFQINMRRGGTLYDEPFEPTRSEASEEFLSELRSAAMELGATDVKYVNVPKNAIFQNKGIPHKSAILFTIEMDAEKIASAPSFEAMREVVKGYRNLAEISLKLSMMLRDQGFAAYPGTALGGLTDYCYLAEIAGIGANGYHGLLITPNGGSRVRINAIYTNITNLPVAGENDHLWIRDLCAMCKQCIRQCPPKAIYDQPKPRGDGGMQCIDHDLCRDYFQSNFGCAVCIAVCPFSRVGYDEIKTHFKGNPTAPYYKIPAADLD